MTMIAPVFAGLALLFALSESPSLPPPTPTPETEIQQQVSGDEENDSKRVAQPVVVRPQSDDPAKHRNNDRNDESPVDWRFIFAAVIAFSAIVQVISVFVQAGFTRRQLRLTKQSADAATQAVQSVKALNRARIVVESLVFRNVTNAKMSAFNYTYKLRNRGKTTAYIFECLHVPCILDELPETPPYRGEPEVRNWTLGPDQTVTFLTNGFEKSQFDMSKLDSGTAKLYALGYIRYRDDFGTEWRARYGRQLRDCGFETPIVAVPGYDDTTTAR